MLDRSLGGDPRHDFIRVVRALSAVEPEPEGQQLGDLVPGGGARLQRMGVAGSNGRLLLSRCYPVHSTSSGVPS
jgi:hypothetical protein